MTTGDTGVAGFEGDLSLENNGGFASVRTMLPASTLAGASALVLRVRGDGKRYQLRLRDDERFDGVAFAATSGTTDVIREIRSFYDSATVRKVLSPEDRTPSPDPTRRRRRPDRPASASRPGRSPMNARKPLTGQLPAP